MLLKVFAEQDLEEQKKLSNLYSLLFLVVGVAAGVTMFLQVYCLNPKQLSQLFFENAKEKKLCVNFQKLVLVGFVNKYNIQTKMSKDF